MYSYEYFMDIFFFFSFFFFFFGAVNRQRECVRAVRSARVAFDSPGASLHQTDHNEQIELPCGNGLYSFMNINIYLPCKYVAVALNQRGF